MVDLDGRTNKMLIFSLLLSCSNEVVVDKLEECRLECDKERKRHFCEKLDKRLCNDARWKDYETKEQKTLWKECLADCRLRHE